MVTIHVREFDYATLSRRVIEALQRSFPRSLEVRTEEGYLGRVHARVLSPEFNGHSEAEKQNLIWSALKDALGQDAQGVSLALAYGTDEPYESDEL